MNSREASRKSRNTIFRNNEQGYKFSMITTGISSHVRYLLEEKGVRLLSLSLLWSEDLY